MFAFDIDTNPFSIQCSDTLNRQHQKKTQNNTSEAAASMPSAESGQCPEKSSKCKLKNIPMDVKITGSKIFNITSFNKRMSGKKINFV